MLPFKFPNIMKVLDTYTKPPECVDIIGRTSQGFHSCCPGSTSP